MRKARRTPHVRCSRCASRRTMEEGEAVVVAARLTAREASCLACGARWRNLRGPLGALFDARRRWLVAR